MQNKILVLESRYLETNFYLRIQSIGQPKKNM